jgi:heme/copper-type cytochrome/quinol oxidase subunit 2
MHSCLCIASIDVVTTNVDTTDVTISTTAPNLGGLIAAFAVIAIAVAIIIVIIVVVAAICVVHRQGKNKTQSDDKL